MLTLVLEEWVDGVWVDGYANCYSVHDGDAKI
jgi:hypothetical protein